MGTYLLVPERFIKLATTNNNGPLGSKKEVSFTDAVTDIVNLPSDPNSEAFQLQSALRAYLAREGQKLDKTHINSKSVRPKQFNPEKFSSVVDNSPEFEPTDTKINILKKLNIFDQGVLDNLYHGPPALPHARLDPEHDDSYLDNNIDVNDNWDGSELLGANSTTFPGLNDEWNDELHTQKKRNRRLPDSSTPVKTRSRTHQ